MANFYSIIDENVLDLKKLHDIIKSIDDSTDIVLEDNVHEIYELWKKISEDNLKNLNDSLLELLSDISENGYIEAEVNESGIILQKYSDIKE